MKKLIAITFLFTTLVQYAFAMPDPIILPKFKTADIIPVSITILSNGSGEFPTARGLIKVKNIGNATVTYKGPDTCEPNPFGGAPICRPLTQYKMDSIIVTHDKSNLITVAPGETKDIEFFSLDLGWKPFKHCQIVKLSLDITKKLKQYAPLINDNSIFADDIQNVFVRQSWNSKPCIVPIKPITGLPNL